MGGACQELLPAVERACRERGARRAAGYPVVYPEGTLYDGSYHPVDSSEMAFKTAVQIAYKTGMPQASPVLLEPIGELKVTIPDSYMGDVIGDLNKRRGRVMGMNPDGEGNQIVEAEVPMAEMGRYAIDLRSMTQGRGSFTFRFVRYTRDAPPAVQEKAIEAAKAMQDEAD
ncbi:MAG: hypothetical protein ACLS63_09430 [Flavonifractor plautii]